MNTKFSRNTNVDRNQTFPHTYISINNWVYILNNMIPQIELFGRKRLVCLFHCISGSSISQFSARKRQVGLLHCISVSSVCPHGSPQRENERNLLRPTITARNDCVVGPHNTISKHMFDHWLCCPPTHWEPAAPPPPMQHFYCLVRLRAQCCQQNLVYPTNEGCNQAQVTPTSALLGRIRILSHIKTVCSTKAKLGVTFLGVQKPPENNKKAWKIYPHQRVTPSSECH